MCVYLCVCICVCDCVHVLFVFSSPYVYLLLLQLEGPFDTVAFAFERLYDVIRTKGRTRVNKQTLVPSDRVALIIGVYNSIVV